MANAKLESAINLALGSIDYTEAVLTSSCWDYKRGCRKQGEMVVDAIGANGKPTKRKAPAVDANGNPLYVPLSVMVAHRASVGRINDPSRPVMHGLWFSFMATKPLTHFDAGQVAVIKRNTAALQTKRAGGGNKVMDGEEFTLGEAVTAEE